MTGQDTGVIQRERPSYTPTIVVTIFFGLVGLWPAVRHATMAKARGYSTRGYWVAFCASMLVPVAIIFVGTAALTSTNSPSVPTLAGQPATSPTSTNFSNNANDPNLATPTLAAQAQDLMFTSGPRQLIFELTSHFDACNGGDTLIQNFHPADSTYFTKVDTACRTKRFDMKASGSAKLIAGVPNGDDWTFDVVITSPTYGNIEFTETVKLVGARFTFVVYSQVG